MAQEEPIKHTAGAEIPDTSTAGEIGRRVQADLSITRDPMVLRAMIPLVLATVGLAAFFVWRSGRQ